MKITLLISTMLSATAAVAETPVLTVYAPDYFASEWGPGPAIEAEFEKTCGCDLQFSAGDLLPRIMSRKRHVKRVCLRNTAKTMPI